MALGIGNLNSCQRCWKHLLKLSSQQFAESKTQTFPALKREVPEHFAAGLPDVRRPALEETQQHNLGLGSQVQPRSQGWGCGRRLSARDTGINVLNGGSSHPRLPTEPVASCLAEATSLSTAGGHFIKCTICSPSLPGSVFAPPCTAVCPPLLGSNLLPSFLTLL